MVPLDQRALGNAARGGHIFPQLMMIVNNIEAL